VKSIIPALALFSISTALACNNSEDPETCTKAQFSIEDGATLDVTLDGDIATVDCPYTCDLPTELGDDEVVDAFDGAASLMISNDDTGVTVNLTDAMAPGLGDPPGGPGEWSVVIDRDGKNVQLQVYNDLGTGQRLRAGTNYTATFALSVNDVADEIDSSAVTLNVQ
jgi:hypothetical protein